MSATRIDGRARAATIREDVHRRATAFSEVAGRPPSLVAVLAGDDPASLAYARSKGRAAERAGLRFDVLHLVADTSTDALVDAVASLNVDPAVDGILVEMPLPDGCDGDAVHAAIDPRRDLDGVTPSSWFRLISGRPGPRPATALAVLDLIAATGADLQGARATVIGRSTVAGMPVALLLIAAHATVTVAHSRTRDLARVTRQADVLVAAAGRPGLVGAEHVRPGAIVIDVGTNVVEEGDDQRIVGDVAYDQVADVASAITPVPGGVGPVTTAMALRSTVELAELRFARDR